MCDLLVSLWFIVSVRVDGRDANNNPHSVRNPTLVCLAALSDYVRLKVPSDVFIFLFLDDLDPFTQYILEPISTAFPRKTGYILLSVLVKRAGI